MVQGMQLPPTLQAMLAAVGVNIDEAKPQIDAILKTVENLR
jgi:hypothetical protein